MVRLSSILLVWCSLVCVPLDYLHELQRFGSSLNYGSWSSKSLEIGLENIDFISFLLQENWKVQVPNPFRVTTISRRRKVFLPQHTKISNNKHLAQLSSLENYWELAVGLDHSSITIVPRSRQELIKLLDLVLCTIDHLVNSVVVVW